MEANMEKELRLDKYLADMNVGTHSEVKIYIRKCRVSVNGEVIRDVGFKVSLDDCVEFDGQQIGYTAKEYIMLHKPAGVITATADKKQDTVFSYLSDAKRKDLFRSEDWTRIPRVCFLSPTTERLLMSCFLRKSMWIRYIMQK